MMYVVCVCVRAQSQTVNVQFVECVVGCVVHVNGVCVICVCACVCVCVCVSKRMSIAWRWNAYSMHMLVIELKSGTS